MITKIMNRLNELQYEPKDHEVVISNVHLQDIREYIKALESSNKTLTKLNTSLFLEAELRDRPKYIQFDIKG